MYEKYRAALALYGSKHILAVLVNLPEENAPGSTDRATEFLEKYGPLFPGCSTYSVLEHARNFRKIWAAKTEREIEEANKFLDWIFAARESANIPPGILEQAGLQQAARPAIRTDFLAGKWRPVAREGILLDDLAIEIVHSRKALARCERPECGKYFIKSFSRDRYCGRLCSEEMRRKGQEKWVEDHREELNQRRRKAKETAGTHKRRKYAKRQHRKN